MIVLLLLLSYIFAVAAGVFIGIKFAIGVTEMAGCAEGVNYLIRQKNKYRAAIGFLLFAQMIILFAIVGLSL